MNNLKYGGFRYSTQNIGDEIQTLAAEQFLKKVDRRFDRDKLRLIEDDGDKYLTIVNGWFAHSPKDCFPPSDSIIPILISFHIAQENKNHFLSKPCIEYFKKHQPIGCRDKGTMKMLQENGVEAYFSGCLTMTFPKRTSKPKNGKIFLVDVPPFLNKIVHFQKLNNFETVQHFTNDYGETKLQIAEQLLNKYKTEAKLIITNRVHCALPCAAMGIPVIFFGDKNDSRLQLVKDAGIPFYSSRLKLFNIPIDKIFNKVPFTRNLTQKILFHRYKNINIGSDEIYSTIVNPLKDKLITNIKSQLKKFQTK